MLPQTGPALRADDAEDDDLADPLLGQARQLVAEHGRASVSSSSAICALLQPRRLLMESLEQAGVVTAMRADGSREVIFPH